MIGSFRKYIYLEALDRVFVVESIDKIVIGKPFEKDGKQHRNVEIHYNFIGTF